MRQLIIRTFVSATILALPVIGLSQNVIVFEEETITGEIEKPEAYYILSPSNLEYEPAPAQESFMDALWVTVEDVPF